MKGLLCRAPRCTMLADYEVFSVSYDRYPEDDKMYREVDERCRYICHRHMTENEALWERNSIEISLKGWGEHFYDRLITNPPSGHYGSFEYAPIAELHEKLYEASPQRSVILLHEEVTTLVTQLSCRPELVYEISPLQFEAVIADVFRKQGFEVELTQASRDGGVDIYVRREDIVGQLLYIVECKRYSPEKKVGIGIVQRIHGIARSIGATKGIVVTTSSFTKPAILFAAPLRHYLSLNDYHVLADWLRKCKTA